jgi:hypothetical protein
MLARAARWALIAFAGANVATGSIRSLHPVSGIVAPVGRRHPPLAAFAFSAVVSMMPGFFLFHPARPVVELVSIGPSAPATFLTTIAANGATAFLAIVP